MKTTFKPELSSSRATELRSILSDPEEARRFVLFFAESSAREYRDDQIRPLIQSIFTRQYEKSVKVIFDLVESPIELVFFNSFLCSCLKNGVLVIVQEPPSRDFRAATIEETQYFEQLFKCYSFYQSLPDQSRPKSFERFLEITGMERDGLSRQEVDSMVQQAAVMFDLGFVHAIHICLQPTFEKFNNGRSVRPDAVAWKPSDPSLKMVVECDGYETHGPKDAFSSDRQRDRLFQAAGYSVRRYSGQEIYQQPIQASTDLAEFLIDQNKASLFNQSWEKRLKRSRSAKPSKTLIDAWAKRMETENGGTS